jgi:hypothetical protein
MPKLQITPEAFKQAKLVKPGWYPTLIKEVVEELNSKKDAMNIVIDVENADKESEFMGVPAKHWLTEKYIPGCVALAKAFNPKIDEKVLQDVEFGNYKGRYIYAKWGTNRGKDGTDPPRNMIEDWAPLPSKYAHLNVVQEEGAAAGVEGFGSV